MHRHIAYVLQATTFEIAPYLHKSTAVKRENGSFTNMFSPLTAFFLEESNGSRHIMNIPVAKINSGEMTEGDRSKLIPNIITVKMKHVEPVIKWNN